MAVDGVHHDLGREALLLACLPCEPLLAVQRDVDSDAHRGLRRWAGGAAVGPGVALALD
jgi:hypothetical protein